MLPPVPIMPHFTALKMRPLPVVALSFAVAAASSFNAGMDRTAPAAMELETRTKSRRFSVIFVCSLIRRKVFVANRGDVRDDRGRLGGAGASDCRRTDVQLQALDQLRRFSSSE